jgi:hypothetical protein
VDVSWLGDLFMVAGWVDGCGRWIRDVGVDGYEGYGYVVEVDAC